ncbi:MAG: D-sedoheptulose 7-phosphate isomerase [Bacteroidetes bacterium]|nr:D-sedoheptulose 7-phosphate isomerase [Bacteroidota bacterium]
MHQNLQYFWKKEKKSLENNMIKNHFDEALKVLETFISDKNNFEKITNAGKLMAESLKNGGKIISCGNGGSMCDAMHFAEELTGRYRNNRKALAAISISDPSHIACVGNDYGYDFVFSRYIEALGKKGDILLAISTSGNSKNVINAINAAKNAGMKIVGLTGKQGGEMKELCDVEIRAPYSEYADRAQEIHIKVIHSLIDFIEKNT